MKLRLILLALALPAVAGLTACGQKDKEAKTDSTQARLNQAESVGISVTTGSCMDNKAKSCILEIDWKRVENSETKKQAAIDALRALDWAIYMDPNPTFDKNQMGGLIKEVLYRMYDELEIIKNKSAKKAN